MSVGLSGVTLARQFARAVLADRAIADEMTRLALADLRRAGETDLEHAGPLLQKIFKAWKDRAPGLTGPLFSDRALRAAIPAPPPPERLMVLLVDVMGFSQQGAAAILGVPPEESAATLAAGRLHINAAQKMTALIIEDEPLIAADLRSILESLGVSVVGAARNAAAAIRLADDARPDVILADYNLERGETGADAVRAIRERHDCRVIFITGFPERVLQGEMEEPDFIIVKPYRTNAVKAAVAQIGDAMRQAA